MTTTDIETAWSDIAAFGGEQKVDYFLRRMPELVKGTTPDQMPVPPMPCRLYGEDDAGHVTSGQFDAGMILGGLKAAGVDIASVRSILEFGCSNGRVLRWFVPEAYRGCEVWGVDIDAPRALWAQQAFAPFAQIAITTAIPHLPFPDGKFDFVFALSILTHIDPTFLSWFGELARILAPNGHAWITIHDEAAIARMVETETDYYITKLKAESKFNEFRNQPFDWFATGEGQFRNVFFRRQWLVDRLAPLFTLEHVVEYTMGGFQTALLLKRR